MTNWNANRRALERYYRQRKEGANTRYIRYHSSDDMAGLGEFRDVTEPVAVVLRKDGSVDVYGYIAVVDQRPGFTAAKLPVPVPADCQDHGGPPHRHDPDGEPCL